MCVARRHLGLSQEALSEQFGYGSARTYQKNEAGHNEPGILLAAAFVRFGINANWLVAGEGDMLLPGQLGGVGGQCPGGGYQVQGVVSEPSPQAEAPTGVDCGFLRLCLGACVLVHGDTFAREPAALQLEYACDLYNLAMKQAAAHGQGTAAGLAAFSRLETRGLADQLRLFLQLGWARVYNSDGPAA